MEADKALPYHEWTDWTDGPSTEYGPLSARKTELDMYDCVSRSFSGSDRYSVSRGTRAPVESAIVSVRLWADWIHG